MDKIKRWPALVAEAVALLAAALIDYFERRRKPR
jgi:hypothetical protein